MKIVVLILSLVVLTASPALAHIVKEKNNIGITLHIEPKDAPVAGKNVQIMVDIVDPDKRFNPNDCECLLTIRQSDKVLKELPIVSAGNFNQLFFTFPEPGTYTLVVDGKPTRDSSAYNSFSVSFEYYVKPAETATPSPAILDKRKDQVFNSQTPMLGGIGLILLIMAGWFMRKRK